MYDSIGKQYGLWTVIDKSQYRAKNGKLLYKCLCSKCGSISYLTLCNIKRSKGRNCKNCLPEYNFTINQKVAIGTLPNGSTFSIDSEDIDRISKYRWYYSKDSGYIVSTGVEATQTFLHRYILNLKHNDKYIVDHIDRNKTNCCKSNLRIVTVAQNTMNKSLRKNSQTGYVGVCFDNTLKKYVAKIQIGHKGIILGKSFDSTECAQMYNVASNILFGNYRGQQNTVPPPSEEMINTIKKRCYPLISISKQLTVPVENRKDHKL